MPPIAVLMPNWIGDFLLALSVVERKKSAENCDISLIVPVRFAGLTTLLSDLPVIPYRRKSRSGYFASVRSMRSFLKLFILPHSFSSALFGFLSAIPVRRGVSMELRGWMLTERLPASATSRTRHLTYEYSEVLEVPFADPVEWRGATIEQSIGHAGAVVLCPGATYGPAKQWPYFDRLAALFPDKMFVILGDSSDKNSAQRIAVSAPQRCTNLAGTTSLEQAASIIAGASVLISNDSGLLHLAGFLGTPCVGIYGSTSSVWTRPLGQEVRIAIGSCPRSPCYERTCPRDDYICLRNVTPETIAARAQEIMRQ